VFFAYDRFLVDFVRCCVVFGFVGNVGFDGYFACFEWDLVLFSVFFGISKVFGVGIIQFLDGFWVQ